MSPPVIEPATFWLAAQCLNQLRHRACGHSHSNSTLSQAIYLANSSSSIQSQIHSQSSKKVAGKNWFKRYMKWHFDKLLLRHPNGISTARIQQARMCMGRNGRSRVNWCLQIEVHTTLGKRVLFISLFKTSVQWCTEGGGRLGRFNPPLPKFRSFDKVEPECKLGGKCLVFLIQQNN